MTVFGVALSTASAILFLAFFFLDRAGHQTPSHLGIITFAVPPMLFAVALLMPFGLWRRRTAAWSTLESSRHRDRRPAIAILVLMGVSVAMLDTAVSKTVEYADSTQCTTEVR